MIDKENEIEMRSDPVDDLDAVETATKVKGVPEIRVSHRDDLDILYRKEDRVEEDLEFKGDPVHQPQDDKIVEPDDIDLADEREIERNDLSDSYAGIV